MFTASKSVAFCAAAGLEPKVEKLRRWRAVSTSFAPANTLERSDRTMLAVAGPNGSYSSLSQECSSPPAAPGVRPSRAQRECSVARVAGLQTQYSNHAKLGEHLH